MPGGPLRFQVGSARPARVWDGSAPGESVALLNRTPDVPVRMGSDEVDAVNGLPVAPLAALTIDGGQVWYAIAEQPGGRADIWAVPGGAGYVPSPVDVGQSKTYWHWGKDSISVTNVDAVKSLNLLVGWGGTIAAASSYTVPDGMQLTITNAQISIGQGTAQQIRLRRGTLATDPIRLYLSGRPPPADYGLVIPAFFGDSSLVVPAGETFCVTAVNGGGTSALDLALVGFLQATTNTPA